MARESKPVPKLHCSHDPYPEQNRTFPPKSIQSHTKPIKKKKNCEVSHLPTCLFNQFNHHSNLSQISLNLQKSHKIRFFFFFNRDPLQLSRGPLKAYTYRAYQIKAKPCKTLSFQQPYHQSPITIFNPKTLKIPPPPQQSSKLRNHKIRHLSIPAPTDQLLTPQNSTNQKPPQNPTRKETHPPPPPPPKKKKGVQNY
jgi:hypothetical protein